MGYRNNNIKQIKGVLMKKTLLAMFAIVAMITLASCDKVGVTDPVESQSADRFENVNYMLPTTSTEVGDIYEATETNAMGLYCPVDDMKMTGASDDRKGGRPDDKGMKPGRPGKGPEFFNLGRVLKALQLTDEQKTQVEGFMQAHKLCVEENRLLLRNAQMDIIKAANTQRLAIIADLKAGTITREEAMAQLKALNEATRTAIQNDPTIQAALAAIKACEETFITAIKGILTPEQLTKFETYLAKRKV